MMRKRPTFQARLVHQSHLRRAVAVLLEDRTVVRGSREFQVRAVSISAPSPNFLPRLRGRDGELQRQSTQFRETAGTKKIKDIYFIKPNYYQNHTQRANLKTN